MPTRDSRVLPRGCAETAPAARSAASDFTQRVWLRTYCDRTPRDRGRVFSANPPTPLPRTPGTSVAPPTAEEGRWLRNTKRLACSSSSTTWGPAPACRCRPARLSTRRRARGRTPGAVHGGARRDQRRHLHDQAAG